MRLPDRVSGFFIAGLGALAAYGGSLLPGVPGQQIGPSVFPVTVGIGLIVCGLMVAFGIGRVFEEEAEADLAAHENPPAPMPGEGSPLFGLRALIPPALLIFYVVAVERIGFVPTAFAMVLVSARALGAGWRLALPLAAVAPLVVHLIFSKLLRVPLPAGLLPLPW